MSRILDKIEKPADLRKLELPELQLLAAEIRDLIISTVSRTGGHLAANLGVVELTIALLRAFDPPADKVVWDVGHQGYTWKILTGRKERFGTLRQFGGLSGFLRRDESPADAFGAGHAGTAVSAALGMAVARDRGGGPEHVVAVVGDGAAGCGITLEAFNHVARTAKRLIVILNDNEMSISANVGALSGHLGRLLADPRYNRWKSRVENTAACMRMGRLRRFYYRIEEAVKGMFLRSMYFEEMGLRYVGPIDGHDFRALLDAMEIAKNYDRPIIVHVATRKGRGYSFAEEHPEKWHGTAGFDVESGEVLIAPEGQTYSEVFGSTLERLAAGDSRIVAITAAMPAGTGLKGFSQKFPDRFFDVGMSEEHAVVFAAGLATEGFVPVFAVYSTFFQRSLDCVIHDVALQKLPVVFCLDRAGVVGDDGPTHHGVFDLALLRPVPNLVIMQPKDEAELAAMLAAAVRLGKPAVIRYPRGSGPGAAAPEKLEPIEIGKAEVVRGAGETPDIQFWALGDMIPLAEKAADLLTRKGVRAGVVNARFARPMDEELLARHGTTARVVATLENGVAKGGFGSGVEEFLSGQGFRGRVPRFGWPDEFIPHGDPATLMTEYGLTPDAIATAADRALKEQPA
ncbi:MAG: 1-deoxy-D-xylulose-5-phosphate synthase [Verrucomicrobiota bacterium]|nr:1-deoxy-D-xylulose-5-phosphate synthase [Verrucomicrobiota bacterium]